MIKRVRAYSWRIASHDIGGAKPGPTSSEMTVESLNDLVFEGALKGQKPNT